MRLKPPDKHETGVSVKRWRTGNASGLVIVAEARQSDGTANAIGGCYITDVKSCTEPTQEEVVAMGKVPLSKGSGQKKANF